MTQSLRHALGDAQHEVGALLAHLSVIRDLVQCAHNAGSLAELCHSVAERIVTSLGYERVAVVLTRGDEVVAVESYTQAMRFGADSDDCPASMLPLVWEVIAERTVLRWGGEGVGARRPPVPEIDGTIIGLPLVVGGEYAGAVLCARVDGCNWDLAAQRAHELIGETIDQIVTLAQMRISMGDIQRQLESELGETRTTISRQEETLREQSERISRLAASLITSNRAKNPFLGLMSHELRTPLSVILGFGSILQDGLAGPVNDEQGQYLERVLSNGRHLNQLVDDMLFFVDAETTRIEPACVPVDLRELIPQIVAAIPEKMNPGSATLVSEVHPESAVVYTDPTLLRRALFHLLGNAFKFTERGEVRIEARRSADGVGTDIAITDTGTGIEPEKLERIFELFRQADDSHTRKREGAGLGLNLVKTCVALLNGRCTLGPGPRGGTRVELWIPDVSRVRATNGRAGDGVGAAADATAGSVAPRMRTAV